MQIITADQAARLVNNGWTVALSGSAATSLTADRVFQALEERYLAEGKPGDLTLFHPQGWEIRTPGGYPVSPTGACAGV